MATAAKFQYNAFAIKPQRPGPPDFPKGNDSGIARRGPAAIPPDMLRAIVIAASLCASAAAFSQDQKAQDQIAARQQACMDDYEKYCKSVLPGGGRIIACLAKEADNLTPACKKAMTEAEAEKEKK